MNESKVDRFLVVHEYHCETCEGNGFVWNPEWAEANEAWDQAQGAALQRGQSMDYAIGAGAAAMEAYWKERGYSKPPPEELRCIECQGVGIVREQVDIMQALAAIVDDDERWEDWREEQEMKRAASRGLA